MPIFARFLLIFISVSSISLYFFLYFLTGYSNGFGSRENVVPALSDALWNQTSSSCWNYSPSNDLCLIIGHLFKEILTLLSLPRIWNPAISSWNQTAHWKFSTSDWQEQREPILWWPLMSLPDIIAHQKYRTRIDFGNFSNIRFLTVCSFAFLVFRWFLVWATKKMLTCGLLAASWVKWSVAMFFFLALIISISGTRLSVHLFLMSFSFQASTPTIH